MNTRALLMGIGLGSALAYVFDPNGGARRRALGRDKLVRGGRLTRRALGATACDMTNRARGMVAGTAGRLFERQADNVTLIERARAKLGRASSHPHAIDVQADGGVLTLRGPCLANDVPRLLAALAGVRGVKQVVNELDIHEVANSVPSLQGERRVGRGGRERLLQSRWVPSTTALVGMGAMAAAGAAVVYARR